MKAGFILFGMVVLLLSSALSTQAALGKYQWHWGGSLPADTGRESTLNATGAGTRLLPKISFRQRLQLLYLLRKRRMPEEHISQAGAAVLCLLLGALGAHRFALGYQLQGLAQLTLLLLILLVLLVGSIQIFGPPRLDPTALVIALVFLAILSGWILYDFFRIVTGRLKPKNGSYFNRKEQS